MATDQSTGYTSNAFDIAGGSAFLDPYNAIMQILQQARSFQNVRGQQMGTVPWIANADTDYQGQMADAVEAALAQDPWLAQPAARNQAIGPLASAVASRTGMPVSVARSMLERVAPTSGDWSGVAGQLRQMPAGQFTNLTDTAAETGVPSWQKQQQDVLNQQWRDTFDVGRQQTAQNRADAYRTNYLREYGIEPPAEQIAQMSQVSPSFAPAPEGWYDKLVSGYNAMKQNLGAGSLDQKQWLQNWSSQTGLDNDIGQAMYQKGSDYLKQYGAAAPEATQNTWLQGLLRGQAGAGAGAGQGLTLQGQQGALPAPSARAGGQVIGGPGAPSANQIWRANPYPSGMQGQQGALPNISADPNQPISQTTWQRLLDRMREGQWGQEFGEGNRRFDIGAGQQLLDLQSRLRGPENYYQYLQTLENAQGTPQLGYAQQLAGRGPAAFGAVGPSQPATIGGLVGRPGVNPPLGDQQPGYRIGGPLPAPPGYEPGGQNTNRPNPYASGQPGDYGEQPYNATRQGGGMTLQREPGIAYSNTGQRYGLGGSFQPGASGQANYQGQPGGQGGSQVQALGSVTPQQPFGQFTDTDRAYNAALSAQGNNTEMFRRAPQGWQAGMPTSQGTSPYQSRGYQLQGGQAQQRQPSALEAAKAFVSPQSHQWNVRDVNNWSPTKRSMVNSALSAQGYQPEDLWQRFERARPQGTAATRTYFR